MNTLSARLLLMTALAAGLASPVRAESINFSYAWTVLPNPPVFPSGTGTVTLTAAVPGTSSADLGSATPAYIPGAELTTSSSATSPPDSFDAPFSLKLTITDTASGMHGDLMFSGTLAGTLTATSSTLTSTLNNPLTQPLALGDYLYSVTIGPTMVSIPSPGMPAALIDARVTVSGTDGGVVDPPLQDTPEPGTLLLGATAVAGLAARRWWKK
ncbi:MAG: PEP-CTERM sorting domain-containing protein [Gemmataceae bacterium]